MTDLFTVGDIVAIVSVIVSVLGLGFAIGRWKNKLDTKLSIIGGKASAITNMVQSLLLLLASSRVVDASQLGKLFQDYQSIIAEFEKGVSNPITPSMASRRQELTDKLNRNAISLSEAKELNTILDTELAEAKNAGNANAALAILLLILLVVAVVAALSGSKR